MSNRRVADNSLPSQGGTRYQLVVDPQGKRKLIILRRACRYIIKDRVHDPNACSISAGEGVEEAQNASSSSSSREQDQDEVVRKSSEVQSEDQDTIYDQHDQKQSEQEIVVSGSETPPRSPLRVDENEPATSQVDDYAELEDEVDDVDQYDLRFLDDDSEVEDEHGNRRVEMPAAQINDERSASSSRVNRTSNLIPSLDDMVTYPTTYVEPNRRWNHKSAPTFATADDDGLLYYSPDPFLPAPPATGAPCTVARMHFASRRLDTKKYKAQRNFAYETSHMESASCEKCHVRFFLPYNHFRSQITYATSSNNLSLPITYFTCPVCGHDSRVFM